MPPFPALFRSCGTARGSTGALLLALATLGALVASPAAAQWKWRDAQGRIQYSDRPPPNGTPARDILQKPAERPLLPAAPAAAASAASGTPPAARGTDPELQARRRAAEAEQDKAEQERQARERQANCSRARDHLRILDSGTPLARVNERGERSTVSEAERQAEVQRTREVIAADCR